MFHHFNLCELVGSERISCCSCLRCTQASTESLLAQLTVLFNRGVTHGDCVTSRVCEPSCPPPAQTCDLACVCAPGFYPLITTPTLICENTDDCAAEPCLNGATCVDKILDYECLCTVEFNRGIHYVILYYIILYFVMLCYIILYYILFYIITLYIISYHFILYYIVLSYLVLYCSILHYIALHHVTSYVVSHHIILYNYYIILYYIYCMLSLQSTKKGWVYTMHCISLFLLGRKECYCIKSMLEIQQKEKKE